MATVGVVLAGGKSTRMGQDKALLTINGQNQLQRTLDILQQTSVRHVATSRNENQVNQFPDKYTGKGPLSGIHTLCNAFPNDNILFVPVDLPLINAHTLQQLIDSGNQAKTNTRFHWHCLPLFIANTPRLRDILDYTLRCTNHFSVNQFCSHFQLNELKLTQQSRLLNTNSPTQWRSALQHFPDTDIANLQEICHGTFEQKI